MYLIALTDENGNLAFGMVDNPNKTSNVIDIYNSALIRSFTLSLSRYQQDRVINGHTIIIKQDNKHYDYIKKITAQGAFINKLLTFSYYCF